MVTGLTRGEVLRVVNGYIGVSGGYLGDFNYRTHLEFYPEFCGLDDLDASSIAGTTRDRFISILSHASPGDQAKILRGVLKRFPPTPGAREQVKAEIEGFIARLEGADVVVPSLKISSQAVERAMRDAETLIRAQSATSGLDRVHTALHAHLLAICDTQGLTYGKDPGVTDLFRILRDGHPRFKPTGTHAAEVTHLLRAIGTILTLLNPLRNRASGAHPNPAVLDPPEAMLAINAARTVMHYLDTKLA